MKDLLKLAIVEDEDYVVSGLKRHLDWERLGIEISGVAADGAEGMKLIIKTNPDLVLTDIRMPVVDGISMIERLDAMDIHPYFIIFSGYDDFNYAKRAMKYGVMDYILKPSLPEEIALALDKTAEKFRRIKRLEVEQEKIRQQFDSYKPLLYNVFAEELFNGKIFTDSRFREKCEFLGLDLIGKSYCVVTVHIDSHDCTLDQLSEEQEQYVLYFIASFSAGAFGVGKAFTNFQNHFAHFLVAKDHDKISHQELAEQAMQVVEHCSRKFDVSVSIGISDIINEFSSISTAYDQSVECLKYNMENNTVIFYRELRQNPGYPNAEQIYNKEMLMEAIKIGDSDLVLKCVEDFFRNIKKIQRTCQDYLTPLLYEMLGTTAVTLLDMGENDYNYEAMAELTKPNITVNELEKKLTAYYSSLMQKLGESCNKKNLQIIQKVIKYVKENYSRDITLNEIANNLYFTPNYLSSLFSRSMGESFSNYITRYRVQKAKELLESGKYKVYEIGEMVGYKNPDYFSKIFKELIGFTPSSYKK